MHDKKHHIKALDAEERSELARRGLQAWINQPEPLTGNGETVNLDGLALRAEVVSLDDPKDPPLGKLHYVKVTGYTGTARGIESPWSIVAVYRVRWTAGRWMLKQLERWPGGVG